MEFRFAVYLEALTLLEHEKELMLNISDKFVFNATRLLEKFFTQIVINDIISIYDGIFQHFSCFKRQDNFEIFRYIFEQRRGNFLSYKHTTILNQL